MLKEINSPHAPKAIGTYSQAISVNNTVYLSGQIPLDPETGLLVGGDIKAQIRQIFKNMQSVCEAAGGALKNLVKINVYLTDMVNFPMVNDVMEELFLKPYPARAAIGVSALPKGAEVEIDGIMVLSFRATGLLE